MKDTEYSITVPAATSTVILPPRDNRKNYVGAWEKGAVVTNGQILRVMGTRNDYLVLVGGTTDASDNPTGTSGDVETSGTATIIHCAYLGSRTAATVTQESDAQIWYHTGLVASDEGGQYAFSQGQQFRTCEQGSVSVYSDSEVTLTIWDK